MKIKIKDFQALKDVELDFPVGITTIVGASNSGKTSIVRAITSVLTNPPEAKTYINNDASKASVNIIYKENNILWERTEKESLYQINGTTYQKVGRTDLFELLPDNGFECGDNHDILNIEDEYSYLFPFSSTDSQIYKIFESAFAINNSTDVLQKIKTDEQSLKKNLAEMNLNLNKTKDKINKIDNFLENNSVTELIKKKKIIEDKAVSLSKLNKDCELISSSIGFIEKCDNVQTVDFDISIFDKYSKLCEDVDFISKNIKIANSKLSIPDFDFEVFDNYFKLEKNVDFILKNIKIINKKVNLPDFDFEVFDNYFKLEKDVNDILALISEYKKLETENKQLQEELKQIEKELESVDVCPLCNQTIKGDLIC